MKRRAFIGLVGSAAAWPLSVGAQPKLPTIGVLVAANPEPFWTQMQEGFRELGYVEGKNVRFEFRSADGKPDRLEGLADELVRLKVDVIVVRLTPAAFAARKATATLPIVMASVADIRWAQGSLPAFRGRAATQPGFRGRRLSLEPKYSN